MIVDDEVAFVPPKIVGAPAAGAPDGLPELLKRVKAEDGTLLDIVNMPGVPRLPVNDEWNKHVFGFPPKTFGFLEDSSADFSLLLTPESATPPNTFVGGEVTDATFPQRGMFCVPVPLDISPKTRGTLLDCVPLFNELSNSFELFLSG